MSMLNANIFGVIGFFFVVAFGLTFGGCVGLHLFNIIADKINYKFRKQK